ncbi:hypothetical protein GCM10019815_20050 [Pediococcus damnosus]|nr:hypothetical protein PDA01_03020 [Pediococcus damnosus]
MNRSNDSFTHFQVFSIVISGKFNLKLKCVTSLNLACDAFLFYRSTGLKYKVSPNYLVQRD